MLHGMIVLVIPIQISSQTLLDLLWVLRLKDMFNVLPSPCLVKVDKAIHRQLRSFVRPSCEWVAADGRT